jgi:4-alpha-glucanotransferase
VGRHHLEVVAGGVAHRAVVLSAPRRVTRFGDDERLWGVFAPVHELWSAARPEPHLGHLARVGEWIDRLGGRVVSTLPLLATFLDRPCDPSPYQPVSRRWWNESYLDLRARPELADCPDARDLLAEAAPIDPRAPFDAPARASVVRRVVGMLADHVERTDGPLRRDLAAFVAGEPDVVRYARFRAMVERTGTGWHAWDAGARGGDLPVGDDHPAVRAHVYAQWAMTRQLDGLARGLAARDQRLALDLALGAHGDGYDTWADPGQFGWGASVGAPPDEFFRGGQDWGFPPPLPLAAGEDGHAHLAACLAAHMRVAGILRIDHVMGLHHLWWVPDGAGPTEGAYVRYPVDELVATVSVESHLAGCVVVGEDLGTVPHEVREAMAEHGLHGMWVAEFAQPDHPGGRLDLPPAGTVASVDTHDTPPWAQWVRAGDVGLHRSLGLVDEGWADGEEARRVRQVVELAAGLVERGLLPPDLDELAGTPEATRAGLAGLLRLVGDTDAACVLVSLDDLVGASEPQNVPGTPADRPNWVARLDRSLADLEDDEAVAELLTALQHARLSSWSRAQR